jgi:hypothetical protein
MFLDEEGALVQIGNGVLAYFKSCHEYLHLLVVQSRRDLWLETFSSTALQKTWRFCICLAVSIKPWRVTA